MTTAKTSKKVKSSDQIFFQNPIGQGPPGIKVTVQNDATIVFGAQGTYYAYDDDAHKILCVHCFLRLRSTFFSFSSSFGFQTLKK